MTPEDKQRLNELKPNICSRVPRESLGEYRILLRKYIKELYSESNQQETSNGSSDCGA